MNRPGCFVKYSAATIPLRIVDTWNWNFTSDGSSSSNSTSNTPADRHHRVLESFVVQSLLEAGFPRHRANRVVLVGELLHLVHRRVARGRPGSGTMIWVRPTVLGPLDQPRQFVAAKLRHVHVRADAREADVAQNLLELGALILFRLPNPKLCSEYHGEQSSMDWNPASASIFIVPGKSWSMSLPSGKVWQPIGQPYGLAVKRPRARR